ncbi:MAG TPA: VCBS repeat-containing protein, partial [Planctomycetota bacterium]|nr:VCBS repeat-containing protein [Planctomycetota bacterium]
MRHVVLVGLCVELLLPGARAQSDRPMFPLQFVDTEAAYLSGLHAADVDADGDVDILTAAFGQLTVLLGDGHGYFPQSAKRTVASFTLGMTVGDIDRDGYADVALSSGTEDGVAILSGAGNGYFGQQASVVPVGHDPAEPVLGDFDGDGDLDLAVVRTPAGTLAVALGDGSGGFGPVASYATASTSALDLAVADLDLDEDLDLVVAFGAFAGLQVFRGDGRGGFVGEPALAAPNPCSDVLAADVTGDGRPDLVASMNNAGAVTMLAGQAGGAFAAAQPWGPSVGGAPHSLAAGDIDGDGDLDIAVGTALSFDVDSVKWLINAGGSSASLVLTPAGYEIGPVALADVNGDGLLDLLTGSADGTRGVTVVLNDLDPLLEAPGQLAIPSLSVRALDSGDLDGDGAEELVALGTVAANLIHVVAVAVPDLELVAEVELNVSGTIPSSIWCGDLDGDGRADLAVPDVSADKVVVVHGQSGGGFGSHVTVATGLDPDFVLGGDVDGDGDLDLVTASRFQDAVAVVWNDGSGGFSAPQVLAVPDAPV